MRAQPNLENVSNLVEYANHQPQDKPWIADMYKAAKDFLEKKKWYNGIQECYVGISHPGVVTVFLFEIWTASADVDRWLWVVVGDLPPAYIASDECLTPGEALDGYINEMTEWIDAVNNHRPTADLIPVNTAATIQNADQLSKRLAFLQKRILPLYLKQ